MVDKKNQNVGLKIVSACAAVPVVGSALLGSFVTGILAADIQKNVNKIQILSCADLPGLRKGYGWEWERDGGWRDTATDWCGFYAEGGGNKNIAVGKYDDSSYFSVENGRFSFEIRDDDSDY